MINYRLLIFYFFISCCYSQNGTIVPDSLKKYTYKDLHKIIDKKSDFKEISLYAKAYLSKAKKENNVKEIIRAYSILGEEPNKLITNLKYSDSSIAIARENKNKALPYLYYSRGDIYYGEKRLKEALNYYLLASKYSSKDSIGLNNRIDYSIGLIKKTQGNYGEAIKIYKKCEETAYGYKNSYYLLYVLGLSELYNRIGKIELSEQYIDKGLKVYNEYSAGEYYLPYFISNRGKNYYKRKLYNEAIRDLSTQLKNIKEDDDFSNYAENCFYIGECYHEQNKDEKAIKYYKKVDSIFDSKKDISLLIVPSYSRLIEYYKKQKKFNLVVFYSEQFIKADKVLDENYRYITNKIAKTYDIQNVIDSKQEVILSLKKDNLFSKSIITSLFLGVIFIILFFLILHKKKKNEIIKQKEQFEAYKLEREQQEINHSRGKEKNIDTVKKDALGNMDENVIKHILNCLEQFEKEQWFLNKEYTVEMLASEFKTNSTYLSKIINEIKQCNFTQYINALRIEYIIKKLETEKKLLLYTTQALSEIAGYNSVQTFTRAFTNHTKMKPSSFLKELRDRVI